MAGALSGKGVQNAKSFADFDAYSGGGALFFARSLGPDSGAPGSGQKHAGPFGDVDPGAGKADPPVQRGRRSASAVGPGDLQGQSGGATDPNRNGSNGLDPTMYCLQSGVPRVYTSPFPIEIVQTPGRIYMVFHTQSNPSPRYIYTDGQGHPEGFPTTFMGHSIGRWEGDTLVVDTTSIDEDTWLDGIGTPHSDALHVVERLRRVTPDTLEIEFRFEDPKAYTKPWTGKKVYKLNKDWEYIPGITCDDRFKTDFAQKSLRDKKDWIEFKK